MFDKLSTALIEKLQSLTKIQSFYNYEASNIEGTPALTLIPSGNESDYSSTTENIRVYGFVLRLYVDRKSGNTEEQTTEKAMRDLVDDVLNRLDANHQLNNIPQTTGYTFLFMEAAPSRWGYAGRETIQRVAEINIRIHFHVDVTLIS